MAAIGKKSCDGAVEPGLLAKDPHSFIPVAETEAGGDEEGHTYHTRSRFREDDDYSVNSHPVPALTPEEEEHRDAELRSDPWRFAVAPIFCVLSVSNAMQWIAFSPIVDETRNYFHMNATQVNFLSTTYVIAYVVIVFLSCKLYEVTGIKVGLVIAASANTLGALVKVIALYAWPHSALLYIAQALNSFTEVLTIATPPLIANRWFPESERMVANTIMSSALNFGCGIGVLIPTFFVGPGKEEKHNFGKFFWFHFGLAFGMLVLVILFFPRKPRFSASFVAARQQSREEGRMKVVKAAFGRHKTGRAAAGNGGDAGTASAESGGGVGGNEAEASAETEGGEEKTAAALPPAITETVAEADTSDTDFDDDCEVEPVNVFSVLMDCFREFRRNWSFILLAIASAAELGLIWGVATVLPQMLSPYGVDEKMSGWIGFLNLVLGTVVCPFFMPIVDRLGRRYKLILCVLASILVVDLVVLTLLLHFGPAVATNSTYYLIITFVLWGGIAGLCMNFMMPLMFEYVVELTFPLAESTSAPVLTWSACLTNFLLTLIFGEVLTDYPTEDKVLRVFIGTTVVAAVGGVALILTKPMTKRQDYERHKMEQLQRRDSAAAVNDVSGVVNIADEVEDSAPHNHDADLDNPVSDAEMEPTVRS